MEPLIDVRPSKLSLHHGNQLHFRWWLLYQPVAWSEDDTKQRPQPVIDLSQRVASCSCKTARE